MKTPCKVVLGLALMVAAAAPARAQGFVSATVGAATSGLVTHTAITYGGDLGYWSQGLLGFEGEYSYSAKTRGGDVGDNIRTVMADLLVGPKVGDGKLRVYGAVGGGLIGAVGHFSDIFKTGGTAQNDPGINVGGGVSGFLSDHWGFRGDVRYVLDVKKPNDGRNRPHFTRFGAGVVLRF